MSGTYVDLFDDGLYDWPFERASNFEHIKNHLRVIIFINLLFDRSIVVPEQWAVSSAACIDVIGELAAGYRAHCNAQAARAKRPADNPIRFSCFERDKVAPYNALTAALSERSTSARRLRLAPVVESEHGRAALTALVSSVTADPRDNPFSASFQNRLAEALNDGTRAATLASLLHYARQESAVSAITVQSYADHLGAYYRATHETLKTQKDEGQDVDACLDLFDRVEKAGVPHHEYVKMLEVIANGDPSAQQSMQHVFRYGMHTGLAGAAGADLAGLSYGCYEKTRAGQFEEVLSVAAAGRLTLGGGFGAQADDYNLVMAQADVGKMPDLDRWAEEWRTFFDMTLTPQIIKLRGQILTRADGLRKAKGADAAMEDLLAFALKSFEAFEFRSRPQNRVEVSLNRTYLGIQTAAAAVGAVGSGLGLAASNPPLLLLGVVLTTASGLTGAIGNLHQGGIADAGLSRMRQLLKSGSRSRLH